MPAFQVKMKCLTLICEVKVPQSFKNICGMWIFADCSCVPDLMQLSLSADQHNKTEEPTPPVHAPLHLADNKAETTPPGDSQHRMFTSCGT